MENLDSVKNRLLAYLKANRITQAEFGRMMGVSTAYVSTMRESLSLLTDANIRGGRLRYRRSKTHHPFDIKITPQARALIDRLRYKGDPGTKGQSDKNVPLSLSAVPPCSTRSASDMERNTTATSASSASSASSANSANPQIRNSRKSANSANSANAPSSSQCKVTDDPGTQPPQNTAEHTKCHSDKFVPLSLLNKPLLDFAQHNYRSQNKRLNHALARVTDFALPR